jgi:iron complex transport system ATP-binding protein
MGEVVTFEDAGVRIGGRRILGPVTLRVADGERWAVLGPNGSGKTTLLRLAGATRQPSFGRVTVLGATLGRSNLRTLRRRIAHVGHAVADAIPTSLTAIEVVLSGGAGALVPWMRRFDDDDRERARALLARFGCAHLEARPWSSASQGERQRILLARALARDPDLLLLDEPAAGLDLGGREALVRSLEDADQLAGVPTILVTHHLEELPGSMTHAALLRDGEIAAAGPALEVLTDERVGAAFGLDVRVSLEGGRWAARAR